MLGWTVSLSTCLNSASGPSALKCKTRLTEKTWVHQDLKSTIWELTKPCQPLPNLLGSLFTLSWGHNEWRTVLWSEYLDTRFPRPQGSIHPQPLISQGLGVTWGLPYAQRLTVHREHSQLQAAVLQVRRLAGGVWELGFWNIPQIIIILCAWAYIVCTNNVILDENLIFFWEPEIFTVARQRMPMWPLKGLISESLTRLPGQKHHTDVTAVLLLEGGCTLWPLIGGEDIGKPIHRLP